MMPVSRIPLVLAVALMGGCAGAPKAPSPPTPVATPAPAPEAAADPVSEEDADAHAPEEGEEEIAQAEGTQVLEIDAGDLGGSVDTITAEPTRPQLPSMMKDIRMGPSG